jgi:hypothetical protein
MYTRSHTKIIYINSLTLQRKTIEDFLNCNILKFHEPYKKAECRKSI